MTRLPLVGPFMPTAPALFPQAVIDRRERDDIRWLCCERPATKPERTAETVRVEYQR